MNKPFLLPLVALVIFIAGCTSIERYAHMHSDQAPEPHTYRYDDGGTSIYYTFTTDSEDAPDTYVFFYGGSGCASWKSVMPGYVDGLSTSARVFVLNKRFVSDKSTGMFGCSNDFHATNNIRQWVSDYAAFISTQLDAVKQKPKNVVLVGVSEGAVPAVLVANKTPSITHVAIIGDGGYTMRRALTTLYQKGKIGLDPNRGWKKIERSPNSIKDSWYGIPFRWWSEIMDYNPMPDYMKLDIPILLGMGENDTSVPVESAYYLASEFKKAGKENLHLKVYKGADHRLQAGRKSYRDAFFATLSQML